MKATGDRGGPTSLELPWVDRGRELGLQCIRLIRSSDPLRRGGMVSFIDGRDLPYMENLIDKALLPNLNRLARN